MSTVYADDITDEVSRRVAGYHNSARIAVSKVASRNDGGGGFYDGGSGGGVDHESLMSPGDSGGAFDSQGRAQFAKQYNAASQDIAYTAIRPIAVRVAGQPIRVGTKSKRYRSGGMRTKANRGRSKKNGETGRCSWSRRALDCSPPFVKSISDGIDVQDDHPILDWLEDPNPILSLWDMLYCTAFSLEACGEAIWLMDPTVDEEGNQSVRFWYWPRHWIAPISNEQQAFVGWKLLPPSKQQWDGPIVPDELVLRFSFPNPAHPLHGHSALQSQEKAVNVDNEVQVAQFASMQNASKPGVVLIAGDMELHPDLPGSGGRIELTAAQKKQIVQAFQMNYRGARRFNDPIILDRIIQDIKPFMPKPMELDFMGSSQLTRNRIMHGIGTNGIIAGQVESANRASAVVSEKIWLSNVVNPLATCISDTLYRKVGKRFSGDKEKVYVWIEECKVLDPEMRLQEMRFLASQGWLTGNEGREAFDLPPDDSLADFPDPMMRQPMARPPASGDSRAAR